MKKNNWLTVNQVIEEYKISQSTVRRIIKEIESEGLTSKYILKEPYKHMYKYYIHNDYLEKRYKDDIQNNANEVIKALHDRIESLENQLQIANNRDKDQREIIKEATSSKRQLQDLLKVMVTKKIDIK